MKQKGLDNFRGWRNMQKQLGKIKSQYTQLTKTTTLAYLHGFILGDGHIKSHNRTEKLVITLNDKYPFSSSE